MTKAQHLPRVAEYGDESLMGNMSIVTPRQGGIAFLGNRHYVFSHHTAGYELAGSAARWTDEKWTISVQYDNQRHARAWNTYERAIAEWHKLQATA